jgi:hypothetical protein
MRLPEDAPTREPWQLAELRLLFTSAVFTEGARPTAGRGEAAFWLPLLGLFTGARLGELAPLTAVDGRCDHRRVEPGRDNHNPRRPELGRRLKTAGCAGASRSWAHRVFAVRGRGEKQRRNGCSPVPIADSRAQGRLRRGLVEVVRDGLLGAGLDVPVIDPVPATVKVCNQSCDVETLRRHSRLEIPRRRARRRAACGDCGCCR